MNVLDIIKSDGTKNILNPEYNPKSKKNKVPKTIEVPDLSPTKDNNLVAIGKQDIETSRSYDADLYNKYAKKGIILNDWENVDKQLSDRQSNWAKAGNALAQTLVSELFLGTIRGFSDLADLIGQTVGISDKDYSNPVSQMLEKAQEDFRNFAPIYSDPEKSLTNGGLTDFGWWASNAPSIISSLTLLLPSTGIVKGISALGRIGNASQKLGQFGRKAVGVLSGAEKRLKQFREARAMGATAEAMNAYKSLNKFQRFVNSSSTATAAKLFLENGATAALSRAMENYQEARQTYNDMYVDASNYLSNPANLEEFVKKNKDMLEREGIDPTNPDAIAKFVAGKAADKTFQFDWVNVIFDTVQIYGLRNAWKGLKNSPGMSAAVRREQKFALRYAGKTPAQVDELIKARSFGRKVVDKLDDYFYPFRTSVLGEWSEGVEEAINYIATQEGMHLGAIMLGDKNHKNFTNRQILDYVKDPELHDAAFWGVLGGVVFQGLGSQFKRIQDNFSSKDNKENDNDSESDKASKEEAKTVFQKLFGGAETTENKRRISEIRNRVLKLQFYKEQLDRINKGIDIYHSTKDHEVNFSEGEAGIREQEAAKKKLLDEVATDLTLKAMNNGNLDMLVAYLSDDNVRKAMVEIGAFDAPGKTAEQKETESKKWQEDVLRQVSKVEKLYDEELIAMNSASAYINLDRQKRNGIQDVIPAEYLQMLALKNVRNRLAEGHIDDELAAFNTSIAELEDFYNKHASPFDITINHRNNIRLVTIAQEIGKLRAENREIRKKEHLTLADQLQINENNDMIASLENEIENDADLVWATYASISMTKDASSPSGYSQTDPQALSEALAYRDRMLVSSLEEEKDGKVPNMEDLAHLNLSTRATTRLGIIASGNFKLLDSNTRSTLASARQEVMDECKEKRPKLASLYAMATALEIQKNRYHSQLKRTVSEVEEAVAAMHNTMAAARVEAVANAGQVIRNLYKDHPDDIREYMRRLIDPNAKDKAEEVLSNWTDEEKTQLQEQLEVLNLTSSYNIGLYDMIDAIFDDEDSKRVQGGVTNPANGTTNGQQGSQQGQTSPQQGNSAPNTNPANTGSQGNSGNSQGSQPSQPAPSNTTSSNGSTGQPGANTSQNQPIDRGIIAGRTPVTTNEDGTYAEYLNSDGTVTKYYGNSKLAANEDHFDVEEGVSFIDDNYVVERYPVFDNNGARVSKGYIRKKTAQEMQSGQPASNSQQGSPAPVNQGQPQGTQSVQTAPVTNPQATSSSTGEPDPLAPTRSQEIDNLISQESGDAILLAIRENPDIDLDALGAQLIQGFIDKGIDRTLAEKIVNNYVKRYKRFLANRKRRANTVQEATDGIIVNSTITELPIDSSDDAVRTRHEQYRQDAIIAFKNAIDDLMKQYIAEYALSEFDGKHYISLENLLRFVNEKTNDSNLAHQIFSALSNYLLQNTSEHGYIVIEESSDINSSEFLQNVLKTREQRVQEIEESMKGIRVDVNTVFNELEDDSEITEFNKTIANLAINQKLKYKADGNRVLIQTEDGKTIGSLTIPKIDRRSGRRSLELSGWTYDILEVNGAITSNLGLLFQRMFANDTDASKELMSILYQFAYDKSLNEEGKNELLKRFLNNSLIKEAQSRGFATTDDTKTKYLVNGLVKFIRYRNTISPDGNVNNRFFNKQFYNGWLKVINENWKLSEALYNNPNLEVSVNDSNAGELILLSEDTERAKEIALKPNEALAGGVNDEIHKLGLVNKNNTGVIDISGLPSIPFITSKRSASTGNTFVIIKQPNGRHGIVYAYPISIAEDGISGDFKEICDEIQNKFESLLDEFYNDPTDENYEKLKEFAQNVFSNSNSYSSLFGNVVFTNDTSGRNNWFQLRTAGSDSYITVYRTNRRGDAAEKVNIGDPNINRKVQDGFETDPSTGETIPKFKTVNNENVNINSNKAKNKIKDIIQNAHSRISFSHFNSDNTYLRLKGIAKRDKNEFVITIGDKEWRYESYSSFVLQNGLVKLNTKPNEDGSSNYNYKGTRTQKANRTLKINVSNPSSPVGDTAQSQQTANPTTQAPTNITGTTVAERVESILKSDSKEKGFDIIKTLLGTDSVFTEENLNSLNRLHLLPKSIIFDPTFNDKPGFEDKNAVYNITNDQIIVGKKFLSMLSNPSTRRQAIRKLIHEKLHQILHEKNSAGRSINRGYIHSLQNVFGEFKNTLYDWINAVENGNADTINNLINKFKELGLPVQDKASLKAVLEHFKNYDFEKETSYTDEQRLEEFLVESITSEELAKVLNMIDAKDYKRRGGARNLFQKILEALSNIFGWNIRRGSLYEKEFYALRNLNLSEIEKQSQPTLDFDEDVNTDNSTQSSNTTNEENLENNDTDESTTSESNPDDSIDDEDEDVTDNYGFNESNDFLDNEFSSITELDTYSPEEQHIEELNTTIEKTLPQTILKKDAQEFLDNFGIKINEIQNYDGDIELFDAVNRTINPRSIDDISDGVGYAVAFMMQHTPQIKELIGLKYNDNPVKYKGIRRSIRTRGYFDIPITKDKENKANWYKEQLKEIGKDIAKELRNIYSVKPSKEKTSYLGKILDIIAEFFSLLNPFTRTKLNVISNNIKTIANAIVLNDGSIINQLDSKPGTDEKANRVFIENTFDENPYEKSIIKTLQKYDIAIAGGTSIAQAGILMRPTENPLHDLDFMADGKTKEDTDKIVSENWANNTHIRTIKHYKGDSRTTETYLIVDRPYYLKGIYNENASIDSTKDLIGIYDAETNELIGNYTSSELHFVEGVNGKFIDFFIGPKEEFYPKYETKISGETYLFSDYRNAMDAKVEYLRAKDIYDYNNFVTNEQAKELEEKRKAKEKEITQKVKEAQIIWGHPAIGKTTYLENHPDEIVEWDNEVNNERNDFIHNQIDPNNKMTSEEYKEAKHDYMANWESHPEYIEFLRNKWNELKEKAKRENKKIFASPLPLLKMFKDEFDLVVALDYKTFLKRNKERGGKEFPSREWKSAIDEDLKTVDKDKLVYTNDYFSDFMKKHSSSQSTNERYSSITELTTTPTLEAFVQTLPLDKQVNFDKLVRNGEIPLSCN